MTHTHAPTLPGFFNCAENNTPQRPVPHTLRTPQGGAQDPRLPPPRMQWVLPQGPRTRQERELVNFVSATAAIRLTQVNRAQRKESTRRFPLQVLPEATVRNDPTGPLIWITRQQLGILVRMAGSGSLEVSRVAAAERAPSTQQHSPPCRHMEMQLLLKGGNALEIILPHTCPNDIHVKLRPCLPQAESQERLWGSAWVPSLPSSVQSTAIPSANSTEK
ncbi:hypothetical protein P7K49_012204 [Saguinus oedipus]|uniref:Uncharacterized protein n=1 Tax=Saguinus oedipus TaxID=9490 RepID=A0ABQ9VSV0_SAGOE|nr:hypothetical protein P7K49_012204 [Saguinus oedipus]